MSRRICVTNIGFRIGEDDIRAYFMRFGPLSECKLQIDAVSGSSRGFAFVTFAGVESAQQCLSVTSHRIQEKSVSVFGEDQFSQSMSFKVPRSRKLFLSMAGLGNVTEASIYEVFQPFGEITSIEIVKSKSTREPIYCLVYFRSHQSVDVCVARSHCINGRQIFIRRAVSREEVKLAEQRERELEAAKAQAKKVYGVHVPTQNVTVVQPRLFSSTPSLLSGPSSNTGNVAMKQSPRCRTPRVTIMPILMFPAVPRNSLLRPVALVWTATDTFDLSHFVLYPIITRFPRGESLTFPLVRPSLTQFPLSDCLSGMALPTCWRTLCEDAVVYETPVDHEACFNKVIHVWKNQCQSLNRRLIGSTKVEEEATEYTEILRKLPVELKQLVEEQGESVEIRKLIARRPGPRCFEVSFPDSCGSEQQAFVFFPVRIDNEDCKLPHGVHIDYPYRISACITDEVSLRFSVTVPSSLPDDPYKWLREVAYLGLLRWIQRIDPTREAKPTNRLISIEKYGEMYNRMKQNTGKAIVENWSEKTDPQKYVYEDCGIATYLVQTWQRLGRVPKRFADLGCGNGLLVHLLNKEGGVDGCGFDIRSRKIWQNMFSDVDLREAIVDPTVFPNVIPADTDYLIGNHSDELTPWIPVMAARLRCEYFVIPCCPFDFHGKYNARPGKHGSSYEGFLQFVRHVGKRLGFVIEEDRMSIPSTKRLCLIGVIPPEGLPPPEEIETIVAELTAERSGQPSRPFVARPKVEKSRNCSNIPRDVQRQLTTKIFNTLLGADDRRIDGWRCGAVIPIPELIGVLSQEEKALMKQQDGGFQTFLKNQHQAFHVFGGSCRIRDWREVRKPQLSDKSKLSPCWMLANHPDGCPYGDQCRFNHATFTTK